MKRILFIAVALIIAHASFAQSHSLYTTNNYEKAIKAGTRSLNGCPGENYWQNTSTYNINVKIDPQKGELSAFQTITYTNNSPDTLSYITFNIFHNLYKKGAIRDMEIDPSDIHDGVQIKNMMRGNHLFNESDIKYKSTIMYLSLEDEILPGQTATFSMDWSLKIPEKTYINMAKYNDNSIVIGQFFPKIAVYDDIDSWDKHVYKGGNKFYSDYSNYDVAIEVPENYIIQATGDLTNASNILHPQIYKRLKRAMKSDKIVRIASPRDRKVTKRGKQTWRFKAINAADFSFDIARNCHWEASSSMTNLNTQTSKYNRSKDSLINNKVSFSNKNYQEKYYLNKDNQTDIYFSLSSDESNMALQLLRDRLGETAFRNTMQAFTKEWSNKHPTPLDFFAFLKDYLKTDYSHYWNKCDIKNYPISVH